MEIGTKIKQVRESKGLTAKFVSSKIGISPSALSRYENNERKIKADLLPKLAKVLGVDIQIFFDYKVGDSSILNQKTSA